MPNVRKVIRWTWCSSTTNRLANESPFIANDDQAAAEEQKKDLLHWDYVYHDRPQSIVVLSRYPIRQTDTVYHLKYVSTACRDIVNGDPCSMWDDKLISGGSDCERAMVYPFISSSCNTCL